MTHEKYSACISACYQCADACDHCATSCLQEAHVQSMADCIHLDRFCAEICRAAASFMAKTEGQRHEAYVKQICALCAQICDDCATVCAQHDATHCQDCARACRSCAEACRKMAA